ncbi:type II toxin-antitoxin system VapC family toxin [Starkeya sp. ORNL1]|uniref:PIN domain-containing protein n=1 Tax=Starkeya sp. ORNL1 TaxID=2709380 RepID=UPI00146410CE|nr:PIN domain-containing protein [Starkeya sp. ORNL1]QJP13113.1 type II toxin-antitoxin system VapC family toxin [Starkeya sp. ORNL1]
MSGYLLDTNAISLLAPGQEASDAAGFRAWVGERGGELFLSAITIAELQAGVSRLERKGATRKAEALSRWLHLVLELYAPRILALDAHAALETGRLLDRSIGAGGEPGFEDAAIAAIAAVHELVVVTANTRHFKLFGVPFMAPPAA